MLIAHIYKNRIHEIFEGDSIPNWPPYSDGNGIPLLKEITTTVNINDGYNPVIGEIVPYPLPEEREGFIVSEINWNNTTFEFEVTYAALEIAGEE